MISGLAALVLAIAMPNVSHSFPFAHKKASAKAKPQTDASTKAQIDALIAKQEADMLAPELGGGVEQAEIAKTKPAAPAKPEPPATPAQRQAARSLDLISQSRFWMDELRKVPTDVEAALNASVTLRAVGSYERSVETASMGLKASPNHAGLWQALALGMVANDQNEAAIPNLQKAIALNPRDPLVLNALGIVYDRLEAPAYAAKAYQAALALAPNDAATLSNYGLSIAMGGDLPRGEAMLRKAVQDPLAPKQTRQNLALVVGLQGRFDESEQLATRDVPADIAADNIAFLRKMLDKNDNRWNQAAAQPN
jgi:Flp pilus assembly protein TadD